MHSTWTETTAKHYTLHTGSTYINWLLEVCSLHYLVQFEVLTSPLWTIPTFLAKHRPAPLQATWRSTTGSAIPSRATRWGYFIPETVSCSWDRLHAGEPVCSNDESYHFRIPGANHLARWIRKVIYCFKIYLSGISSNSHLLRPAICLSSASLQVTYELEHDQLFSSMRCSSEWSAAVQSDCTVWHTVTALHQGLPGQMTW